MSNALNPKRDIIEAWQRATPIERREAIRRFMAKVDQSPGLGPFGDCWEWRGQRARTGLHYGLVGFLGHSQRGAHRIAFLMEYGDIPTDRPWVLHGCDNPPCVRPDHLHAGTTQDNTREMAERGRAKFLNGSLPGEDANHAKLSNEQVLEILRLTSELPFQEIASRFGVCPSTVSHISTGRKWGHVTGRAFRPIGALIGGHHPNALLTDREAACIISVLEVFPNANRTALAAAIGVGIHSVNDISRGRSWRHLREVRHAA